MIVVCSGYQTCKEDCECKKPHILELQSQEKLQSICGWMAGSCYHDNHIDEQFHECIHVIYQKENAR